MSEFCLLAASLLSQSPVSGWKLAEPPSSPAVLTPQQRCVEGVSTAVQPPEAIALRPVSAASPQATSRMALPGLDPTGSPYLPQPTRSLVRPVSGSQLYQQRVAALRSGRVYTRLPASSYAEAWRNATAQPTYEQWVTLLAAESRAIARGQGANRLTVLVGDSLYLWGRLQRSSGLLWYDHAKVNACASMSLRPPNPSIVCKDISAVISHHSSQSR